MKISLLMCQLVAGIFITSAFLIPVQAKAEEWSLSIGAEFSSGDYGQARDTDILYMPFTIKYRAGDYSAWLTIPYLMIDGPGNVAYDLGRIDKHSIVTTNTRSESGIGDVIIGISKTVYENSKQNMYLDITGKVKLATADETKSLGTGKNDYSIQADWYQKIKKYNIFATAGYTFVGDPPGVNLKDVTYFSAGISQPVSPDKDIGAIVDVSGEAFDFLDHDREEITGYLSHKLNKKKKLVYYGVLGLKRDSPDMAIGITYTYIL